MEAVTNLLFLVSGGLGTMPEEQIRNFLTMADDELRRVGHITRQTLGFYRETSAPASFDVPELVDEVVALHDRQLKHKSITVERHYAPTPQLFAVKGEIRQVLANLITNAIDASPAHSQIQLDVRTVGHDHHCHSMRVTVIDHGVGIPRENRRKVFEPFFTTKDTVGTGLGLWVTREIVTKHGGCVHLRSSVNPHRLGTIVSFSIPLARSSEPMHASSAA